MSEKRAVFLLYQNLNQLDLAGPLEVISRMPGVSIALAAPTMEPVTSDKGVIYMPTEEFSNAEKADIFIVPGGPGVDEAMLDPEIIKFAQLKALECDWLLGVCTGTLLLGAAGLLDQRVSTGHWQSRHLLSKFGAIVSNERVVVNDRLITSAGVTSGIDAAFELAIRASGEDIAKQILLHIEYSPEPPYKCGSPATADSRTISAVEQATQKRREIRSVSVERASAALGKHLII
ncbi:DJ-1/PfpI family protein [Brucella pseudogrignonensis]